MLVVAVVTTVLVAATCARQDDVAKRPVSVVATTTILGDVAGRVVTCGGGEVSTLMPIGADPHEYAPSSAAMRNVVLADLVVANGLGLEEGLASALATAKDDGATVVEIAPLVDPIPLTGQSGADATEPARSLDPHIWLDVGRMADAAEIIGTELAQVTGDDAARQCGRQVADELRGVDEQVRDILAVVPPDHRVLITDHQAFGYFALAYDFDLAGTVVPGGSDLGQPSSEHLAELVRLLNTAEVSAIFGNVFQDSILLDALAAEVSRPITVVPLYVGSLGPPDSAAADYPSMMRTNAQRVVQALAEGTVN